MGNKFNCIPTEYPQYKPSYVYKVLRKTCAKIIPWDKSFEIIRNEQTEAFGENNSDRFSRKAFKVKFPQSVTWIWQIIYELNWSFSMEIYE